MSLTTLTLKAVLIRVARTWLKDWAKKSVRPRGEWRGAYIVREATWAELYASGYPRRSWKKCVWVQPTTADPRRFCHESGYEYRLAAGVTDGVSAPAIANAALGDLVDLSAHGMFADDGYLHDGGFRDKGFYVRANPAAPWEFMEIPNRHVADTLMSQSMTAHPKANRAAIVAVRKALWAGSWRAWRRHRRRRKTKQEIRK